MKTIKNVCLIAAMSLFIISCEKDVDASELEQNNVTSSSEVASKAQTNDGGALNELQLVSGLTAFVYCNNGKAGVQGREVEIAKVWKTVNPKTRGTLKNVLKRQIFRVCKIKRIGKSRK